MLALIILLLHLGQANTRCGCKDKSGKEGIPLCALNSAAKDKYNTAAKTELCDNKDGKVAMDQIIEANIQQIDRFYNFDIIKPKNRRRRRRGIIGRRWPISMNGLVFIPYTSDADTSNIIDAIEDFNQNTCIRFRKRTGNEKDYVHIRLNGDGCWSDFIGRKGGRQEISLPLPQCISKGVAIHELMHVIGFAHEHQRRDRDKHIKILYENIKVAAKEQMDRNKEMMGEVKAEGYDLSSVMHYGRNAAARSNGLNTILPLPPHENAQLGQRDGFSPTDIQQINKMYMCTDFVKPIRQIKNKQQEINYDGILRNMQEL